MYLISLIVTTHFSKPKLIQFNASLFFNLIEMSFKRFFQYFFCIFCQILIAIKNIDTFKTDAVKSAFNSYNFNYWQMSVVFSSCKKNNDTAILKFLVCKIRYEFRCSI
jgi:hypothetical protein